MQAITQAQYCAALNGVISHGTPESLELEGFDAAYYVEHKGGEFVQVARKETESGPEYYGLTHYPPCVVQPSRVLGFYSQLLGTA